MACVYTFKDAKGQEVRLEGIPALKSYLVEGGLEEMFPERELPRSVADILGPQFSKAQTPQLYSQLRKSFESAPDKIFSTGPQTKLWLKGNAAKLGIKSDEVYWTGIEDYLDAKQGKVSRDEVLAFLDENGVKTEDVVLGGEPDTERSKRLWADANYALTEFGNAARKENLPLTINGKQYFDDDLIYELEDGLLSASDLPNNLKPLADKWLSLTSVAQNDPINSSVVYKEPKHGGSALTLHGGKNYQETVVTIPSVEKFNESDSTHFGDVGKGKQIAWMRHNIRTDEAGNESLFLEEIQSQRGQEGRKMGFTPTEARKKAIDAKLERDYGIKLTSRMFTPQDVMKLGVPEKEAKEWAVSRTPGTKIPSSPFVSDSNNKATNAYITMLLKKAVLNAIENGQSSVSWTTGEQQADRYDLSKHVDAIGYYERGDAYNVTVWGKGTEDEYGPVVYKNESATRDDLEQNLGKELANKIIIGEGRKDGEIKYLEDLDLKVGGEWAQSMYGDSQGLNARGQPALITQAARDIAKRFGGKVGSVELSTGAQPALIITPEMKAKVLNEGLPLFSRIRPDQTANIFEKTEDAVAQLTSDFGVGIQSLLDSGVLILGFGKTAWPESAKSVMNGDEEAVYVGGKIYVDLQHTAKDRLKAVMLHEIGEHFNLRKMLGSKAYSDLQNQITHRAKIEGSVAQQMWNRVAREYSTLEPGSEKFVAEVIARLGEHNPNAPWYKRLLAQVKSFLLKHGLARGITAKTITENDIHELLLTSLRSAARGVDQRRAILYGQAQPAFSAKEGLPEKINIDGKDRWTVNSEGKPIAQTEEGIRNFWKWFKDSKVVDENGKPLVVYHGTDSIFTEFYETNDIGYHFGTEIAAKDRAAKVGGAVVLVEPIYISKIEKDSLSALNGEIGGTPALDLYALLLRKLDSPRNDLREQISGMSEAEINETKSEYLEYADSPKFIDRINRAKIGEEFRVEVNGEPVSTHKTARDANARASRLREQAAKPMTLYLNIKNPIRLSDLGVWSAQEIAKESGFNRDEMDRVADAKSVDSQYDEVRRILESKGYDGIIYRNEVEDTGTDSYIAFNANQIKSAIGNIGAFSEESNDIRFSSQPLPPATPPTAQEQSHWYDEVKDKLDKLGDNLFRDRLALFTVEQITELAQRYMPGLSTYNDLLQARTAEQSRWMRDADQLVSEKWRKLDTRDQARLHNTIQKSTLSDIDASRPWSGIEKQASGKTGAKQPLFYVYTQTTLSGRYQKIAARVAKGLKANNISKAGAIFGDEAAAKTYFERLQRIERNQQAFQAKYASGRENAQRKQDHASIVNLYNALPEDAKYVYSKANDLHNAMFKSKLETHLENIEQAVENLEVRKQMVQEVRYNFENKKLNWYYAPLSRFGRHWLYGTTADGKKWYSTYETEPARAKAEETLKASGVTIKGKGTSLENLNNPSESGIDDKFIADITQLIAAANLAPEAQRELGDEIYQMYLSSLPDVSMRKNGMHRENVLGFSEDAMRSFSNAMHHGSSQLANMKYGRQMKRVLDDHERAKGYAEMPGRKQGALEEIEAMSELRDNWENWSKPGELEAMIENAKLNDEEDLPLYEKAMTYRNKLGRMDIEDAEDTLDNLIERAQKVIKMSELIKTDDFNKAAITLEELAKSHDFMMNTASTSMDRVATALNQVNFVMMLGFSLSGGLVNMLQTPGAAIPIVLGKHSAAKTISAFNKAFMDFMSAFQHQLKDEDGNTSITGLLPERIRQAESEGRMADVKRLNELLSMLEFRKEDGTISRTQTFDIIGVGREGSSYGSPLQSFMQKAGWMFHHAERLNREVTLVAAYELARDSGKSHQEASDYAKWVTDRAHLNYTSENAARLFRGPLSRIALQFKKYTQGMMFLWGKTAADALASVSRDKFATEAEWQAAKAQKREAARTLAALFLMQTSMAGALGLPLMGVLGVVYGMLGAAVGDDDDPWNLERDLRLGLAKFIGDDAAEAATKGFINSFTPLNVSSRLDMADIFFRDPNKELEGRDAATHYVSEIMGATGGTVSKTWQGVKYLADGYYMRGAEALLPKAVSDLVKTARFAKEGARTLDDKPLREVSADELMFQIMGFGSSAQERMYAEREYVMQKENAIKAARSKIIHEAAKAYMNGEAVPTEARIAWNKKHPEWPIQMDNIRASVRRQRQIIKDRGDKGYNTNPKLGFLSEEMAIKD